MKPLALPPRKVIELLKETLGPPTAGVTFLVNPVPASRPRVTRWGVYYGKNYTKWREVAMEIIKEYKETISDPVTLFVENIVEKPKTSKKKFPRGDFDNYAKGPADILTKKSFWEDDDLVVNAVITKRFADPDEEPRTEVSVYVHQEPN